MEKRRDQRIEVNNFNVDISDGLGFFSGTMSDISRFGMKVDHVAKRLDDNAKQLSIVMSGNSPRKLPSPVICGTNRQN